MFTSAIITNSASPASASPASSPVGERGRVAVVAICDEDGALGERRGVRGTKSSRPDLLVTSSLSVAFSVGSTTIASANSELR